MNDDSTYGTVSIGFDIDTTGEISEINILNSIHPKLDSNAVAFIRNTHTKWIPSYKNGEKRPSHKVFNLHYQTLIANYKRLNQNATSISKRYLHNIDYSVALEYFMDKQYEKAMIKLNKVCNYSIDNPSAFYYRGLTHLNLGNAEKGC
jgi:TonB family protein